MSTLLCFGFGYSAQHYVAGFGGRFTRIIGTTRSAERAAALAGRDFGGRRVEMLVFGGEAPSRAVADAAAQAESLLVSAPPDQDGDPVLGALHDTLAAAPGLRHVVLLSTIGVYGDHGGAWVDETTATAPTHERARERQYDRYRQEIQRRVQNVLVFPKVLALRLEQGEAVVTFVVRPDGGLGDGPRIVKSSGFEEFDTEAVKAVQRAAPFPRRAETTGMSLSMPVTFENPLVR